MYPSLPKSYKGLYPFKIGTTSFIYPAGYAQNVKMLGPYVDEIELLLFEGAPDSLPSTQEIKKLLSLSKEFDLTYNVHLPTDISLSDNPACCRGNPKKSHGSYRFTLSVYLHPASFI